MPRIVIRLILLSITLVSCTHPLKEPSTVEAAAPTSADPTLYNRIGGTEVLKNFANQFVQQIALNSKIMSNPLIAGALSKNQSNHKEKLATLLCQISGGPCKYEGHSVKESHASLKITEDEWREMTRVFIQVLQNMKVQKRERQDLAKLVARYKSQIVK